MNTARKINKIVFLASLIVLVLLAFVKQPFPSESSVKNELITTSPIQNDITKAPFTTNIDNYEYEITPQYSYELYGLVVSQYDTENWFDVRHKDDPGNTKDLCVVWGNNLSSGVYKNVKYKSGEFTCFYSYGRSLEVKFDKTSLSNNHLIPANDEIYKKIKNVSIGDQVHVSGYLASYKIKKDGRLIYKRGTSTTRDDSGNGACEVIYVTDFQIIKPVRVSFGHIRHWALTILVFSGIFGVSVFLFGKRV